MLTCAWFMLSVAKVRASSKAKGKAVTGKKTVKKATGKKDVKEKSKATSLSRSSRPGPQGRSSRPVLTAAFPPQRNPRVANGRPPRRPVRPRRSKSGSWLSTSPSNCLPLIPSLGRPRKSCFFGQVGVEPTARCWGGGGAISCMQLRVLMNTLQVLDWKLLASLISNWILLSPWRRKEKRPPCRQKVFLFLLLFGLELSADRSCQDYNSSKKAIPCF